MILTVAAIVLVSFVCLVVYPALIVALAASMTLECDRAELPVARIVRKCKTGRRFQRPVYQRAS